MVMKYNVGGSVVGSTYIGEFEAESPQEAFELAYKQAHVSVCHQCADGIQDPEIENLWAEDEAGNVTQEPGDAERVAALQAEIETLKADRLRYQQERDHYRGLWMTASQPIKQEIP